MTAPRDGQLLFYATPAHDCSYLPGRDATTVFADPGHPKNVGLYTALSRLGFRRSGAHIYRPHCEGCQSCIPIRIPAARFTARRRHRRVRRAARDIAMTVRPASFEAEHFELYRRYLSDRHPGSGMEDPTEAQYREFLTCGWCDTLFYEFSIDAKVVSIAVVDRLADALSCVYTFFEPALAARGLGTLAVLEVIADATRQGLPWVYLGYYIEETAKMRYKASFHPHQRFINDHWVEFDGPSSSAG